MAYVVEKGEGFILVAYEATLGGDMRKAKDINDWWRSPVADGFICLTEFIKVTDARVSAAKK